MKIIRLVWLSLAAITCCDASAFCVYNDTNQSVYVFEQTTIKNLFKGMVSEVKGGKEGCCNWQNKDCNPSGKGDAKIDFQLEVGPSHLSCFRGSYDAIKGSVKQLPKIDANAYIRMKANPKFDKSKSANDTNPRWIAETYTRDDRLVDKFGCPGYVPDKPGLMDFL